MGPEQKSVPLIWFLKCAPRWNTIQILQMYWYRGNIRKYQYIGWFFVFAHVALQSENHGAQKNAADHGDNKITKPDPKELTEHHGS